MSETMEKAVRGVTVLEREGFLRGSVVVVAGLGERVCEEGFAALREARTETFTRLDGALEWVDGTQQAFIRFGRAAFTRTDRVLDATLETVEACLVGSVRLAKGVALGATELASRATVGRTDAPTIRAA